MVKAAALSDQPTSALWYCHPLSVTQKRPEPRKPADPATQSPPLIIWLHGWGQSGASLLPLARLFAAEAENRVYDLPGFGKTPMLQSGAGSDDYAKVLYQQLDHNRPVILVGHSFGARIAVRFAARYPDHIAGLILIAGAGLKRPRSLPFRLRALGLKQLGRLARRIDGLVGSHFEDRYKARFGSADYRAAGALRPTLLSVVNEDLSPQAARILAPCLLLYGALDDATPPSMGQHYQKLIRGADFHCLDGFGHLDILSRGAFQCQQRIAHFLERL
ncbi:alpha/beta hydrolase [Iodidimonas nitroreducens]|uniref:Alpha/beta hydrolase n=1 Tax=Iodidimonas nitroreducens TaxID=1236968 RepID=A0A5A7N8V3_9PROT|nr:alpha/beta fold hydrolase [Iodidimonas nitroreducens]GAK34461.1 pimelyl-[acyl-carrier protein] methyl ester esterase [alpha proteobacterium Q-1]GER04055.1 alpha/beta hydrolase [Iodidimonas nitroreducens]